MTGNDAGGALRLHMHFFGEATKLLLVDIWLLQDWPCHAMWPEKGSQKQASELDAIPEEATGNPAEALSPANTLVFTLGLEFLGSSAMASPLGEPACLSG